MNPVANDEDFKTFKLIAKEVLESAFKDTLPTRFVYWFNTFLPTMEKNQFTATNYSLFFDYFPSVEEVRLLVADKANDNLTRFLGNVTEESASLKGKSGMSCCFFSNISS